MDYGKRIKDIRESIGMSGRALALKSGLDPSQINKIEHSVNKPSLDSLESICDALGISLTGFFSIEQGPSALPPDLYEFVIKKENRDLFRCIAEMKEKGYTSEGITDILGSLQKIVDDAIKVNNQVSFTDVQEDTNKLLKDFTNKKNKKSK
jgi:transcriptional regulator with XRE-family HTH domain